MLQEFYSALTGKRRVTAMLTYLKGHLGILARNKVLPLVFVYIK